MTPRKHLLETAAAFVFTICAVFCALYVYTWIMESRAQARIAAHEEEQRERRRELEALVDRTLRELREADRPR